MPSFEQQKRGIERRRRMAETLMAQSQQPQAQQAGRFLVGPTALSGVASLGSALRGNYLNRKADRIESEAEDAERKRLGEAMDRIMRGGDPGVDPVTGQGPAMNADPRMTAAREVIGGLPPEQQQQLVAGQALKALFPPAQDGYTLGQGEARFEGGKQVASVPARPPAEGGFSLSAGQTRFADSGKQVASVPAEPPKAELPTPTQLVTRPGPSGMLQDYAFDPRTQKMTPVGQPYVKQAPLSPKDTSTAKQKLTQIKIAREQLAHAREKFQALKGSFSAGPKWLGQGLLPTEEGKAFDAAIDGMRGTIGSLVRVPGIGAMSDYETRLDQGKFPERGEYESVTEQKLQQLDSLLQGLDGGYSDMLGGASDVASPDAPAAAPAVGTVEAGYRFKGGDPSKPENWEPVQ